MFNVPARSKHLSTCWKSDPKKVQTSIVCFWSPVGVVRFKKPNSGPYAFQGFLSRKDSSKGPGTGASNRDTDETVIKHQTQQF